MNSEKITYVKPTALDLGPVSPIYGGICGTGGGAASGCNPTGSAPGPFTCSGGSVVTVCSYGDGDFTR